MKLLIALITLIFLFGLIVLAAFMMKQAFDHRLWRNG